MNKFSEIYYELEGVAHDLENQFDPKDGGVCARTVRRVQKMLAELEGVSDGPTED
jgi:hypothetical protein